MPDYPGAFRTDPAGINNAGTIVGYWCCVNNDNEDGGFLYANGGYIQINYPGTGPSCAAQQGGGECTTYPQAINDARQIVGIYIPSNSTVQHAFLFSNGQYSTIDPPATCGSYEYGCAAYGISDSGTIGISVGPTGVSNTSSFLLNAGNFTSFAYPGASFTFVSRVNSQGWILGSSSAAAQFLAIPASLVDPVPDLMSTTAPTTISGASLQALGLHGRVVQGIAADGVSEVLVRIPAINVGDQFTITLFNDQQPATQSDLPAEDGALGSPGATTFTQSQITATAIAVTAPSGSQAPIAFVVYRAPLDFARQNPDDSYKKGACGSVTDTDDSLLACRSVSLQIQNQTQGTTNTLPITILRPPLVMVHGLWDDWQTWNKFSPLITGPASVDNRFSIGRASYDFSVGSLITASNPSYSPSQLKSVGANSLGFGFNAPYVLAQTNEWIANFRQGQNPLGIAAAGVQADIVAHSMGGDITRTIVLPSISPTFLSNDTFGEGSIHKLITIDTPHLGSPLASQLGLPREEGGCVELVLAHFGKFPLVSVSMGGGISVSGAIGDLALSSPALSSIANQGPHPLPTALIAGVYTNWASLGGFHVVGNICGTFADPLALDLTPTLWPNNVFAGEPNDAIVSQASQLNGLDPSQGFVSSDVLHSKGVEALGFAPPTALDSDSGNPSFVITALNTPVTSALFKELNP